MIVINTLTKFCESIGISTELLSVHNSQESYYIKKGIDVTAFKRLMIKNDMDEYTVLLLYYFTEVYKSNKTVESIEKYILQSVEIERNKQHEINLTETLLFLLSNDTGANSSITFQKSRKSFTMPDQLIIQHIVDSLIVEFKNRNYHKVNLTYNEAKAEMLKHEELKAGVYREQNIGSDEEPIIVDIEFEEVILDYADNTTKEMEVTNEFLKKKLKDLTKSGKKKGAKIKNSRIAYLVEDLSILKRIDKYINKSEVEYITNVTLTNEDCRFIHDCLVFFNIIEDKSNTLSTSLPENYIRSLIKQKKQDEFDYTINQMKDLRIKDLKSNTSL